jgi:glutathione synthase/RimK-type ligase-like ATP-grasp enzyme
MTKRILLLVPVPQVRPGHLNWIALRDLLRPHMGTDVAVEMSALSQLTFVLDGADARVYDEAAGYDLADFDAVVFRTIGKWQEEAIAAAAYCRARGVRYIDQHIPEVGNAKLSCAFVRYEQGLRVPPTAYGPGTTLAAIAGTGSFAYPVVLKDTAGKKGRDNYLVRTSEELRERLEVQPDIRFVMQAFIPNDGDYRILVFNDRARMAILRRAAPDGGHLNNTSQGGSAEEVPLDSLPAELLDFAVEAAKLERLSIAGVDIITERTTGTPYILEVNRSPQIGTGAFADKKTAHYAQALRELVEGAEG